MIYIAVKKLNLPDDKENIQYLSNQNSQVQAHEYHYQEKKPPKNSRFSKVDQSTTTYEYPQQQQQYLQIKKKPQQQKYENNFLENAIPVKKYKASNVIGTNYNQTINQNRPNRLNKLKPRMQMYNYQEEEQEDSAAQNYSDGFGNMDFVNLAERDNRDMQIVKNGFYYDNSNEISNEISDEVLQYNDEEVERELREFETYKEFKDLRRKQKLTALALKAQKNKVRQESVRNGSKTPKKQPIQNLNTISGNIDGNLTPKRGMKTFAVVNNSSNFTNGHNQSFMNGGAMPYINKAKKYIEPLRLNSPDYEDSQSSDNESRGEEFEVIMVSPPKNNRY